MRKSRSLLSAGPMASVRCASLSLSYHRQNPSSPSGSPRPAVMRRRKAGVVSKTGMCASVGSGVRRSVSSDDLRMSSVRMPQKRS